VEVLIGTGVGLHSPARRLTWITACSPGAPAGVSATGSAPTAARRASAWPSR